MMKRVLLACVLVAMPASACPIPRAGSEPPTIPEQNRLAVKCQVHDPVWPASLKVSYRNSDGSTGRLFLAATTDHQGGFLMYNLPAPMEYVIDVLDDSGRRGSAFAVFTDAGTFVSLTIVLQP